MGKPLDLVGDRYGRLVVLEKLPERRRKHVVWRCICDCGAFDEVTTSELRFGRHRSCGCYQKERASEANRTHGESQTRLYRIWCAMIKRCENEHTVGFENYGGRGISVCHEWRNSYTSFRDWALSHDYRDDLTLDRIDVNSGYDPDNCRWATHGEQMNNTRRNKTFEYNGERHTLREWSEITGVPYHRLRGRVSYRGWTIKQALELPKMKNQFTAWEEER